MTRALPVLAVLLALAHGGAAASEFTSNDVYVQTLRIEQEVAALKRHFKITEKARVEPMSGDLQPRHVTAKSYVLLLKLGKLRRKLGLPYVEPVSHEPQLETSSRQSWAMTQRLLMELAILKRVIDIPGQAPAAVAVSGKRPIDNYNRMNQISADLDLLAGVVTASDVYIEAKRLNDDVDAVLHHLRLFEKAVPPPRRENLRPKDSLRTVFAVLAEIQRLQQSHGLQLTDFRGFDLDDKTVSDDVLSLVGLARVELSRLKFQLGMQHDITPPSRYVDDKTSSDVVQLLGYVVNKLREIRAR